MNILTTSEYEKEKIKFLHKHLDWDVTTSPMDEYGRYRKTYICSDGAQLTECMGPVYKTVEIEVNKVKIKTDVKLFETESWNTDNPRSVFCYEKF